MTRRIIVGAAIAVTFTITLTGCGGNAKPTYGTSTVYTPSVPRPTTSAPPASAQTAPAQTAAAPRPAPTTARPASAQDDLDKAVREASDYFNSQLAKGSKIAILNIQSNFPALSEYIIEELVANTVNDKVFSVVDRKQLDVLRGELQFQMSGDVDDASAQKVGSMLGAQVIISGGVSKIGDLYRMRIRALNVQSAQIEGQFNRNIMDGPTVSALVGSQATAHGGAAQRSAVSATAARPAAAPVTAAQTQTAQARPTAPPVTGTAVPGDNLTQKMAWLYDNAKSHGTYILEVRADDNIAPQRLEYPEGTINITIVLRGVGENRTVRIASHGAMFTVRPNVTLVLDNNVTLHGHNGNSDAVITVDGGMFRMNAGSAITGNLRGITEADKTNGGGVHLKAGTFNMNGGSIFGNSATWGGGVVVLSGAFTMADGIISGNTAFRGGGIFGSNGTVNFNNGTITGNTASEGGGMYVGKGGTATMNGGTASENIATSNGGGAFIGGSGTFTLSNGTMTGNISNGSGGGVFVGGNNRTIFTMSGGIIVGNNATANGGGIAVHSDHPAFNMRSGTITGNTAGGSGGGVDIRSGEFSKTGGTITGYANDSRNGNIVKNDAGVINNMGHAIYGNKEGCGRGIHRRETTAAPGVSFRWSRHSCSPSEGVWEN